MAQHHIVRRDFIRMGAVGAGTCLLGSTGMAGSVLADSAQQVYVPGTYSAQALGKKGMVTVEVDFDESAIVDVRVSDHHDTVRITDAAISSLSRQIVGAQTLNVDTVAGATLSSVAILSAVEDCVAQAGGDVAALRQAPAPAKSDEVVDIDADFVIVGAGGSGLPAAIAIAQAGLKVVMFERNAFIGGSMMVSDGRLQYTNAPEEYRNYMTPALDQYFQTVMSRAREIGVDESIVAKVEEDYAAWQESGSDKTFDSQEFYGIMICVGIGSPYLFEYGCADQMMANLACTWLTQEVGVELERPLLGISGFSWPRATHPLDAPCGTGYADGFEKYIADNGLDIQILLETPATALVQKDGFVCGATGTCADGTLYNVTSRLGVLLATGGYGGSSKWLAELDPEWGFVEGDYIPTVSPAGHEGSGLDLAVELGAKPAGNGGLMLTNYAHPKNYILDHVIGDNANPLLVNANGERFIDETLGRTTLAKAVREQPDGVGYLICSERSSMIKENGLNYADESVEHLLEDGLVFKADTLEELAEAIGIPADTLVQTVERYNAACVAGAPDEFGRTYFEETAPLVEGPFYASPGTWAVLITTGGLAVDDSMTVLAEDGSPIAGLYAVGEVCGEAALSAMGWGLTFGLGLAAALAG